MKDKNRDGAPSARPGFFRDCQKSIFDSLKTPNFLQNYIIVKNVAPLPEPLLRKALTAIYLN